MSDDAQSYTMERLDDELSEWEQGGKPRFVSDDLRATVAENVALRERLNETHGLLVSGEALREGMPLRIALLEAELADLKLERDCLRLLAGTDDEGTGFMTLDRREAVARRDLTKCGEFARENNAFIKRLQERGVQS